MEAVLYKMTYKKDNNSTDLRVLGEIFVKNNRNKGILIINNKKKKFPLNGLISYDDLKKYTIKLLLERNTCNKSYLFKDCKSLESLSLLPDKGFLKNEKNYDDDYFSEFDKTLSTLSKISYYESSYSNNKIDNFKNEITFSYTGSFYFVLTELKPIFVTDIRYMFYNCESLLSLPDLSKLITNEVTNMSYIFFNCKSLESLSLLSDKDPLKNEKSNDDDDYRSEFNKTLSIITEISDYEFSYSNNEIYDLKNEITFSISGTYLYAITDLNPIFLTDIRCMFYKSESLLSLPDISKLITNEVTNMSYTFFNCK